MLILSGARHIPAITQLANQLDPDTGFVCRSYQGSEEPWFPSVERILYPYDGVPLLLDHLYPIKIFCNPCCTQIHVEGLEAQIRVMVK